MSVELSQRKARITIDDLRIEGLRVQFKVKKTLKKEPNTADIVVTNFSAATRSRMQKRGARIILEAGYKDTLGTIFSGDARNIDQLRAGPDWLTKIQCGDGEISYQFARASVGFGPGVKRETVVQHVLSALTAKGVTGGNVLEQVKRGSTAGLASFLNGFTDAGKASTLLDSLLKPLGLDWSIQDGQIQALGINDTVSTIGVSLSPTNGLIGSPEHGTPDKKGKQAILKVKCLLRPELRPGVAIQLVSDSATGLYRVETVEHVGDTAGQEWYSQLDCKPI